MTTERCEKTVDHKAHTHGEKGKSVCPGTWEYCTNCADAREKEGLDPMPLTTLGLTKRKKLPVFACPNCDGKLGG